ncbi:Spore coat U domain-containing protein [Pseudomonas chlororaphis]|uniref:Csu type fimbrial protein n=1 Tax=Pseudomonas chlororaphis TaxID=587753 RepID=UPI0039E4EB37
MNSIYRWNLLLGLAFTGQVFGSCSVVAANGAAFGSVSSIAVRTALQTSSTINAGLRCNGSPNTQLTASDHFFATIAPGSGGMVGPTGDVISYTIYGNNSTSYPLTRGTPFDFASTGIAGSLGLVSGPGNKTVPLYLSSIIGSNIAAGIYTEILSITWSWDYCSASGNGNNCQARDIGSGTTTLTVSMTVTNDCQITAPDISFGSAPVISAFSPVTGQTFNIACTKGSAYTVGLSDGQHGLSIGGRRRMISGGNYLQYDIFQGGGTTRWGSVGTARRASSSAEVNPGSGIGTGSQIFNYNAKIYTDQATPPAGTYLDNVVLDVAF